MTKAIPRFVRRAMISAGASILLSGMLWAQAAVGNNTLTANSAAGPDAANGTASGLGKAHDSSFVIGNDDVLAVNVWKEQEVTKTVPVRSDGKISLPLVGEIQAAGQTPLALEHDIAEKLKGYIAEPEVTVIVQQINSQKFNILGYVTKPGSYTLTNSPTVLDAIALAGGFRDFAKQKSIYVLRQNADGTEKRIPFNYKEVVKGIHPDQNIKLQARDTIVVP